MTPYELARKEIGTLEWQNGSNPKVLVYYADAGHAWVKSDEVAWCAAFVGAMLARAGLKGTGSLAARSYLDWGTPVALEDAKPGDIVIFSRGKSKVYGHVAFYVRHDEKTITVVGGNQRDMVSEAPYSRTNPNTALLGVRTAPGLQVAPPSRSFMAWILNLLRGGKR